MKLPFERWGSGSTEALFLHGFAGCRASFSHLGPLLGDVLHATCVELPGHGPAPLAEGGEQGAWNELLDALAHQLVGPAVIIGYSQGARLALGFAVRHPDRVQRLVLESGSAGLRRPRDRTLRRAADETLARVLEREGVDAFMSEWERRPLFAGLRKLPEPTRTALRARRAGHSAQGLAGALRCFGQGAQPDYWPALASLKRPTLLLTGARDAKYTRLARRMAQSLPSAVRVSFAGVGHAPHLECPERWAFAVRNFLATGARS